MNRNQSTKHFSVLLLFFLSLSLTVAAQTSVDVISDRENQPYIVPVDVQVTSAKSNRKPGYDAYYDQLIVEYQERMVANIKKYQKMAKEMEKPQYSDHAYFGHKRKPKKRPVGKRKFCKECELVH